MEKIRPKNSIILFIKKPQFSEALNIFRVVYLAIELRSRFIGVFLGHYLGDSRVVLKSLSFLRHYIYTTLNDISKVHQFSDAHKI